MKTIEIVGENYCGNWDKTRTACRGIVIDGDRILLSYAAKTNQWMKAMKVVKSAAFGKLLKKQV